MRVIIFMACIAYAYGDGCAPGNKQDPQTEIACERNRVHRSVGDAELKCGEGRVIIVTSANWGRTEPDKDVCPYGRHHRNYQRCKSHKSLNLVQQWCNNKQECSIEPSNSAFGDPCYGTYKYLEVTYECVPKSEVHSVIACERNGVYPNIKDAALSCKNGEIKINSVNWGRTIVSQKTCKWERNGRPLWHRNDVKCTSGIKALNQVIDKCENQKECSIAPTNRQFGDSCPGTYKYLHVTYTCEEKK